MPDNWTFVAAAYVVATLAFGAYWRWLNGKEREIKALTARHDGRNAAVRNDRSTAVRNDRASRSHNLL